MAPVVVVYALMPRTWSRRRRTVSRLALAARVLRDKMRLVQWVTTRFLIHSPRMAVALVVTLQTEVTVVAAVPAGVATIRGRVVLELVEKEVPGAVEQDFTLVAAVAGILLLAVVPPVPSRATVVLA